MKCNDCNCKKSENNLEKVPENIMPYSNYDYNMSMPMANYNMAGCGMPSCNTPVRRHLEPVLVARIYEQPIIEEIPYSSMSLTLDETVNIASAYSDMKPMCGGNNCMEGYRDDDNYPV